MSTYLVTRHPGTVTWARARLPHLNRVIEHLDPAELVPGDVVVGTLPVHLACRVCERGARYLHLTIDSSHAQRGRELTADDLERLDVRICEYVVQSVEEQPLEGPQATETGG